jgi:hypothetical protein
MNHLIRAVLAIVLGAGLAAAAQAQDTSSQSNAATNQGAAPAQNMQMQNAAPTIHTHRAVRAGAHKALATHGVSANAQKMTRQQVRMVQKQNRSLRTASLSRHTSGHQKAVQRRVNQSGLGVGSSMPDNSNAMNSPATTGAGATIAPSNTGSPATKY